MILLCPHLTKARFPAGLLQLPSKSSWPPVPLGTGRRCLQKMVLNTRHRDGLSPSVQKLPDLRDKDEEEGRTKKLLCSHQQFDPWSQVDFTNTADSQDYHYREVKWHGLNQTGLFILNYMLKINLINLYWTLNLFRRYCKESRHQQQHEKVFEKGL